MNTQSQTKKKWIVISAKNQELANKINSVSSSLSARFKHLQENEYESKDYALLEVTIGELENILLQARLLTAKLRRGEA